MYVAFVYWQKTQIRIISFAVSATHNTGFNTKLSVSSNSTPRIGQLYVNLLINKELQPSAKLCQSLTLTNIYVNIKQAIVVSLWTCNGLTVSAILLQGKLYMSNAKESTANFGTLPTYSEKQTMWMSARPAPKTHTYPHILSMQVAKVNDP